MSRNVHRVGDLYYLRLLFYHFYQTIIKIFVYNDHWPFTLPYLSASLPWEVIEERRSRSFFFFFFLNKLIGPPRLRETEQSRSKSLVIVTREEFVVRSVTLVRTPLVSGRNLFQVNLDETRTTYLTVPTFRRRTFEG